MKRFTFLALAAGFALLAALVGLSGIEDVLTAVEAAGWATLAVVAARGVAVALDGLAWGFLFPPGQGMGARISVLLRFVREGINQLLPVGQVGGDLVGARLAGFWSRDGALAGATVIVDVAVQAGTQFVFALVGLALLVWLGGDPVIVRYAGAGLAVAALALAGFWLAQRRAGSRLFVGLLRRLAGGREWLGVAAVERLWERLGDVHAGKRGLAICGAIHMAVWFFGAVEVWITLRFMGHPVSVTEAIVIESLGQAVRGAAFAIPGALGAQEGGFIALCAIFGVPAGPALAMSLVKRAADLAIGLPGLVAWQTIEGRRVFGARAGRPADLADCSR